MSEPRRGIPARIGIAALNLLMPGLGLQRLGRGKAAALFLSLAPAMLLAVLAYYAVAPSLTFAGYAISSLFIIAVYVVAIAASAVMSWRGSREKAPAPPWWSKWYVLVGGYIALSVVGTLLVEAMHGYYKPFYIPAESMTPNLLVNDRLLASMRGPGALRRGDIILFDVGRHIYIQRVAALPGDRIAMQGGVVILNGRPVGQRLLRREMVEGYAGRAEARRLAEQFPGEATSHDIYDFEHGMFDDMAEQRVALGHVFVLGDNRDHSADSRVPRADMGVEQLPIRDIRGRALFHTWGPSGKMGEPLNR